MQGGQWQGKGEGLDLMAPAGVRGLFRLGLRLTSRQLLPGYSKSKGSGWEGLEEETAARKDSWTPDSEQKCMVQLAVQGKVLLFHTELHGQLRLLSNVA